MIVKLFVSLDLIKILEEGFMKSIRLIYFVGMVLLLSVVGLACGKKETADTNANITKSAQGSGDVTPTKPVEATKAPESGENSPWKLLSTSTVETAVFYAGFLNESLGVTVGYEGAVSYTSDGGKTWTDAKIKPSACRYGLDYLNESFLVTSGNFGVNRLSKDKGKTWSDLGEFPLKSGNEYNKFLSVIDQKKMYIGAPKSFGVTTDGGKTWKELALPKDCKIIAGMNFMNEKTGYILSMDGNLFKTNDSCKTWTKQPVNLFGEMINKSAMSAVAINFKDENNGTIVFATKSYKMLCITTKDGGANWENVPMPKVNGMAPYLSKDGKYLTVSSVVKNISLYQLNQ